ncbi:protein of unknown function [Petrocella atlantisensis]|uniref:Uncharacterized protein n=1 Tax=Petrocella atlantisensis TaxID=2173034 RepID=A0A3P7NVA5_9FIRM|nr:hypothetical protein [Petrocella atlantisensis]VDN47074.1 protein of unknown function [Petrocella atlantisensis]
MSSSYIMHREGENDFTPVISNNFWNSLRMYVMRKADADYFSEYFCGDRETNTGFDESSFLRRLTEELGCQILFFDDNYMPETLEVLSFAEYVYRFISVPISTEYDNYHRIYYHTKFDSKKGRYEFTVQLNDMFKKFKHPYEIKQGKISRIHSKVLDDRVDSFEFSNDKSLNGQLKKAIAFFREPNGDKKLEALGILANILERIKTYEGDNKKRSIEEILYFISTDSKLIGMLDNHIKSITMISNECNIRHKELSKIGVNDERVQEFLFYSYYNIIRLILDCYKEKKNTIGNP